MITPETNDSHIDQYGLVKQSYFTCKTKHFVTERLKSTIFICRSLFVTMSELLKIFSHREKVNNEQYFRCLKCNALSGRTELASVLKQCVL